MEPQIVTHTIINEQGDMAVKQLEKKKENQIPKKLKLGHQRTCQCGPTHINCMTAKQWIKSQLGVWQFGFESRDIRDKSLHPATFPISLAKKCIELFSHKGELILDPFVGSGTTLVAARDLDRNAVGFDLKKNYVELTEKRLNTNDLFNLKNA